MVAGISIPYVAGPQVPEKEGTGGEIYQKGGQD
jgi:hypothetical protein